MRVGVSSGVLRHYVDGVDALIAETYRATSAQLSETVNAVAAAAGKDKRARLIAYVTANFQPPVANPTLLSTWIAFWRLIKTRSEEHTSELQTLMRISYAVFCLYKKKTIQRIHTIP